GVVNQVGFEEAWEDHAMSLGFLDHMRVVPDHRIPGMVTYPLDEVLLATLVGVVCGADDWEGVEEIATGALDWLRDFLPFAYGIPTAQTLRKVFRLLDTQALQRGFAAWTASLRAEAREVIAVDGKTLRGSKTSPDGKGALHLVSAYATEAGLVLAQQAVDGKSNEITAIPELLDMLNLKGAIVSIDAMGPQKARRAPRPTPATAGSKSAVAGPPRQAGSPNAIPTGKACIPSPPSPPDASTRKPAAKASRPAITSRPSNPAPRPFSPQRAPIGESRFSTGRWT